MNASKKSNTFRTALVLATALLLWSPFQAGAFSPDAGGGGAAGGPAMQQVNGKVVETMDSGGYTYALVDDKGGLKIWVAMPRTKVAVGNEILCQPGMVMSNFNSPSLNRTFERIVFSQGLAAAPVVK